MEISLTRGKTAIIDDRNFPLVSGYRWYAVPGRRTWYAQSVSKKYPTIAMHRLIIGAKSGEQVDHVDGNGLNNLESNLRIATSQQQRANSPKPLGMSSRFKGVTRRGNRWAAQVVVNGENIYLGVFDSEEEAAAAYDIAALNAFGEFSRLNTR